MYRPFLRNICLLFVVCFTVRQCVVYDLHRPHNKYIISAHLQSFKQSRTSSFLIPRKKCTDSCKKSFSEKFPGILCLISIPLTKCTDYSKLASIRNPECTRRVQRSPKKARLFLIGELFSNFL